MRVTFSSNRRQARKDVAEKREAKRRADRRFWRLAVRSYEEFCYGANYHPDPYVRHVREHGGHASGGGGCC